jgi:hypothetical protein
MLAQSIKNFQCKKIFFAGCHDAGYMHDLNEYQADQGTKDRIVLLETTPAHHTFRTVGYELAQFGQIFRSDPLEPRLKQDTSPPLSEPIQPISQVASSLASHGASLSNSPQRESPVEAENIVSSGNGGHSIKYSKTSVVTYATVGRADGQQNISLVAKNAKAARPTVNRNARGQRVDSALQAFNNNQVIGTYMRKLEAIKPQGFCNEFYLLGKCERRPSCKMDHETTLTDQEVAYHRTRARQTLCGNGPMCDRYGCYLSHHCPSELCSYGKGCKFKTTRFGDLHYEKVDKQVE